MLGNDSATPQPRILVLDSNVARAEELSKRLRCLNYQPVTPGPGEELAEMAAGPGTAIMLGDLTPGKGVRRAVRALTARQPALPIMHVSGMGANADTVGDLKCDHSWDLDFPLKPTQLTRLLRRAERYRGCERRVRLTGHSRSMRDVRKLIEQVSDFDTSVLITGESGTGKELVARTIHDLSERSSRPFVPINCGAIPSELLESELFGHEKGAFTGAVNARKGRFELAEGGTLFLDEIGDMSLPMQTKLLRVLQERTYERVGGSDTRHCNVRIVAATHRNLPEAVVKGDFREDLYYRLNVFPIEMPPLYKRISDLPVLLDELLVQHQCNGDKRLRLSEEAIHALSNYSWPGNIRELSNLVERLAILHPTGEVGLADLPKKYRDAVNPATRRNRTPDDQAEFKSVDLKDHLQKIERDLIDRAMQKADGVVARAARLLSLRRTTLAEKINKHGL